MTPLEEFKARFAREVNESHIQYAWDGYCCYSYLNLPLKYEAKRALHTRDFERFTSHTEAWLREHQGKLYDIVSVVGDTLVGSSEEYVGEDAKEYALGLIELIERTRRHEFSSWYGKKVEELRQFLANMEFEEKVLRE